MHDAAIDGMRVRELIAVLAVLLLAAACAATDHPAPAAPVPATNAVAFTADDPRAQDADLYEDTDPSALAVFRSELEPAGRWVDDPTWGTVWVPYVAVVGEDFAPYQSAGHWAIANDGGWIWVSDYPWGWVVFHYGRWVLLPDYGWVWIPGRRYAHAWVVWRVGEPGWDYVGWAPMPPSFIWVGGVAVWYYGAVVWPWWFVPSHFVFHYHVHRYTVLPHHAATIVHHTHVHPAHHPAAGRAAHPHARLRPASPTLADARVPVRSAPIARVAPERRAVAVSRRPVAGPQPRAAPRERALTPRRTPEKVRRPSLRPRARPALRPRPAPKARPQPRAKPKPTPRQRR